MNKNTHYLLEILLQLQARTPGVDARTASNDAQPHPPELRLLTLLHVQTAFSFFVSNNKETVGLPLRLGPT